MYKKYDSSELASHEISLLDICKTKTNKIKNIDKNKERPTTPGGGGYELTGLEVGRWTPSAITAAVPR